MKHVALFGAIPLFLLLGYAVWQQLQRRALRHRRRYSLDVRRPLVVQPTI